jgi:hypothetical protein
LGEICGRICEGGCIDAAPALDQRASCFVGAGDHLDQAGWSDADLWWTGS